MRRLAPLFLLSLLGLLACAPAAPGAPNLVGQVREIQLATGTRPEALVAGPDGNLWFAGLRYVPSGFADVVGKVTPSGEVTEFTVGTHPANLGLSDIAVGPDGNLWFSEGGRPKIGRITTAGQITEFGLPDPAASPASIVAGPDGNLWFTEFNGGRVGRVTPSGEVTEFPLRDGSVSSGIATASDGALWITQPLAGALARIGTDGLETRFPLPEEAPAGYPGEIVAGPDGALWFGKQRGGVLGRMTTGGEVTQIPVPGGRQTYALSSGPYDSVWYSNGGGRIGWTMPGVATGEPACINSCRAPISALAEGPEGKLWFAAGVEGMALYSTPGTVGTYAPPPLEIRVLGGGELRGRTLLLPVRCRFTPAGSRCRGRVELGGPGRGSAQQLNLRIGRKRRVALRLPGAAARRLAEQGRLALRATTQVAGGRRDARRIVLRRP
jgi:streptogramin lyase